MADNSQAYEKLSTANQVRVNAFLIEAFQDPAFVTSFRNAMKTSNPGMDRAGQFQAQLDHSRDKHATDIEHIPQVNRHSKNDTHNLGQQKVLLRNLQGMFAEEKEGVEHKAADLAIQVKLWAEQKYDTGTDKNYVLPKPDYDVKAAAKQACLGIEGKVSGGAHVTKTDCQITPTAERTGFKQR